MGSVAVNEKTAADARRFVLALDKFKGTLTAVEACECVREGLVESFPGAAFDLCPIADGGDGTVDTLEACLGGERREVKVENAVGSREVMASYLLDRSEATVTAYLEMASASGLALLESGERDPLRATTFGTGQLMQDAIAQGARRLVIGLGGSATNDGGMGIARAFGYRFWDDSDASIETPDRLPSLERIERPERLPEIEVLVLADVTNPLLGPRGATAIYGPQKGVTADTAGLLESALECLADRVARDVGEDPREAPGAGAAGGCAYGLLAFLGAQVVSGFDYICERVGLESAVERGDVVITGEGRMDGQTLSGKGPAGVADRARRRGKVVAAVCGAVDDAAESALREVFGHLAVMTREVGESAAMNAPAESLRETARRLGADLLGEAARVAGKDPGP